MGLFRTLSHHEELLTRLFCSRVLIIFEAGKTPQAESKQTCMHTTILLAVRHARNLSPCHAACMQSFSLLLTVMWPAALSPHLLDFPAVTQTLPPAHVLFFVTEAGNQDTHLCVQSKEDEFIGGHRGRIRLRNGEILVTGNKYQSQEEFWRLDSVMSDHS